MRKRKRLKNGDGSHLKKDSGLAGLLACLASALLLCCAGRGSLVYATSSHELRGAYEDAKEEAEANKDTARKLADAVREMNLRIADEARLIEIANREIAELDEKISDSERELILYEEKAAVDKDFLYKNIRAQYESGGINMISAFLGSESLIHFLDMREYTQRMDSYFDSRLAAYSFMTEFVKKQRESLNELKTERNEELIAYERERASFDADVKELSALMEEAKKKAEDAEKFASELARQVAMMEAEERRLLMENGQNKDGAGGDTVIYAGTGTDYYYTTPYPYSETELLLMAGIIEAEAGSSSYPGMIAVGSVVMNRVESPRFDNTIQGVIYATDQFEPVRTGRLAVILANGPSQACMRAAKEVLEGKRNVHNYYFKADWYAAEHGITGVNIGGNVFH